MKKILIVNEWLVGGGVEKVMKDLILSLPETEYQLTLVSFYNDKRVFRQSYPTTIKYHQLKQAYRQDHYPSRSIRHIICAVWRRAFQKVAQTWFSIQNFDVAIAMEEGSCMNFVSKVRAKKRLAWIHTDYISNRWTKGIFSSDEAERLCMMRYDQVVCVSQSVAVHVKQVLGDPGNLCVRYNLVDEKAIQRASLEKLDVPMAQKSPLLVTVGRLCEAKAYGRLQKVCKKLNDEGMQYELWIVGDGELAEELHKQKAALCLDNVHYLGNQSNPYPYMKRADWFLCSSVTEGFSTVLQESVVLGVPIISTECSGTEELLGKSKYGIMIENSEEALYEGLRRILTDDTVRLHYRNMVEQRKDFVDLEKRKEAIRSLL